MANFGGPLSSMRKAATDAVTPATDTTSGVLIVYSIPALESTGNLGFTDFTAYTTYAGGTLI